VTRESVAQLIRTSGMAKKGKDVPRVFSQHSALRHAAEFLHERIPKDVTQLRIENDNSFACAANDFLKVLGGIRAF